MEPQRDETTYEATSQWEELWTLNVPLEVLAPLWEEPKGAPDVPRRGCGTAEELPR